MSGACQTSLISVIATPREFRGRKIRFTGYLVPDGQETRIYLDRESAAFELLDRSVLLIYSDEYPLTQKMFLGPPRYVSVLGRFSDAAEQQVGMHRSVVEAGVLIPTFPPTAVRAVDERRQRDEAGEANKTDASENG